MRTKIRGICCVAVILCFILGPCIGFYRYCSMAARASCISAQGQIAKNLEDVYKRQDKKAAFTGVWEKSFALSDALVEAGVMDPEAISLQRNSILCHQRDVYKRQQLVTVNRIFFFQRMEKNPPPCPVTV